MSHGTIKWFNRRKGYGFIERESGADVFVHTSEVQEDSYLKQGQAVEFELGSGEKGPCASQVRVV